VLLKSKCIINVNTAPNNYRYSKDFSIFVTGFVEEMLIGISPWKGNRVQIPDSPAAVSSF